MRGLLVLLAACGGSSDVVGDASTADVAPMPDAAPSPVATIAPTGHDFGSAPVGGASAAFAFAVTNPGATAVALAAPPLTPDFTITDSTCTTSLAAGASCAITVQMTPTTAGALDATLAIGGATATLTGQGSGAWLAFTPTTQDFGTLTPGQSSIPVTFTVTNTRGLPLPMPTFTFSGTGATQFLIGASTCTAALEVGASCTAAVVAKLTSTGAKSATLTVAAGQTATAMLTATGVNVDNILIVTPSIAFFDPAHTSQTFDVANVGGIDLTPGALAITGSNPSAFSNIGTTCVGTIAPGGTCTFTIAYTPAAGDANASARFSGATSATVSLVGTSAPMTDLVTQVFVDFGNTYVDTDSTRTITFKNTGTSTSEPLLLGVSGTDAGEWTLVADHCTGVSLAPSASCSVDLVLHPTYAGIHSATLTGLAGALNAHAHLTGMGVSTIAIAPAMHDFGAHGIGAQSAIFTFVATNVSGNTIAPPAVSLASPQFPIATNGCTADLEPNASCAIGVRFAPTANGSYVGMLHVGASSVVMYGEGANVDSLVASDTHLDFGTVAVGASAQKTITLSNFGPDDLGTPSLARAGANAGDFTATGCTSPLATSSSCTITVTVAPSASGTRNAALLVSVVPGGNISIALTAVAP